MPRGSMPRVALPHETQSLLRTILGWIGAKRRGDEQICHEREGVVGKNEWYLLALPWYDTALAQQLRDRVVRPARTQSNTLTADPGCNL